MKIINRVINKIKHEILRAEVLLSKYEYGTSDNYFFNKKIIVSLTTFPARFNNIELCLKSILRQTIKPNKIIVWLGSDSIDYDIDRLFSKYTKYGIEFRIDKINNYKSHKKYLYAFKEYPNDIIITLDDDLVYPKETIETLINTYKKFPNSIIARRVHKITWDKNNILPYKEWIEECDNITQESHNLFATTGAGTLFPPNSLYKDYCNFDLITKLSPNADDVWLKFMAFLNNTKIVWAKNNMQMPTTIKQAQGISLQKTNVTEGQNDVQIRKVMQHYNITKEDFDKKER